MTLRIMALACAVGLAMSVGCSEDDKSGSGPHGGGGAPLACPTQGDASDADPSSGNDKAEWVYAFEQVHQGQSKAAGAAEGGVLLALGSYSAGASDPVMLEDLEVYEGGDISQFVTVAHLDASAEIAWAHGVIPGASDSKFDYSVASTGDALILAMSIEVPFSVAGTDVNADGAATLLVARISESGAEWVRTFGMANPRIQGLVANGSGEIALGLGYEEAVDLGSGMRTCSPLILKLGADGQPVFDRCMSLDGEGFYEAEGLAMDSTGDVLASGFPLGDLDVGLGTIKIDGSRGGSVLFKMSGDSGDALWQRRYLGAYASEIAVFDNNEIVTVGHVPNLDDATVIADDTLAGCTSDEFHSYHVSRLDADGIRMSTVFTGRISNIVPGAKGRLYLAGPSSPEEAFLPELGPSSFSTLIALDADGSVPYVQDFETGPDDSFAANPVVDGQGDIYMTGSLIGSLELENGKGATVELGYSNAVVKVVGP